MNEIHEAAITGNLPEMERLLANQLKQAVKDLLHAKDEQGRNATYLAAANGHLEMVRYLINKSSDCVFVTDDEGNTAVHASVMHGHLNIVRDFLETPGLLIDSVNKNGWTYMHLAARYGQLNILRYLVEERRFFPSRYRAETNDGRTVFDLAAECEDNQKREQILTYLTQAQKRARVRELSPQSTFYLSRSIQSVAAQKTDNELGKILQQVKADMVRIKKDIQAYPQQSRKDWVNKEFELLKGIWNFVQATLGERENRLDLETQREVQALKDENDRLNELLAHYARQLNDSEYLQPRQLSGMRQRRDPQQGTVLSQWGGPYPQTGTNNNNNGNNNNSYLPLSSSQENRI